MDTQEKKGLLISIEGIDGSGKTTLAQEVLRLLLLEQYPVMLTKEPGGTSLGQKIRALLLDQDADITPKAEFLLFTADRAQHMHEVVEPLLNKGYIVISDRMADSSLVYQGYGRNLERDFINKINCWSMNNHTPDLTFYLQITPKNALERINKRGQPRTSFEKEEISFMQTLVNGFDEVFRDRNNVVILNALEPLNTLGQSALQAIKASLLFQQ